MASVTKPISKKNKGNPSVLEALGIKLRPNIGKRGISVVAADRRVEYLNDVKAKNELKPTQQKALPSTELNVGDLHRACRQAIPLDLEFILKEHPEFLNQPSTASEDIFGVGGSSLHFAVAGNNPEVLCYLLGHRANLNATSERGITPLHLACSRGYTDCAIVLIDNGGNMFAKDNFGNTPSSILKSVCPDQILAKQRSIIQSYSNKKTTQSQPAISISSKSRMLELTDKILYR